MNKDTPQAEKNYTQRRLEELRDEFSVMFERADREEISGESGSVWQGKLETFLSTSIQQALAEDRERIVYEIKGLEKKCIDKKPKWQQGEDIAEECAMMIASMTHGADCGAALKDYEELMADKPLPSKE